MIYRRPTLYLTRNSLIGLLHRIYFFLERVIDRQNQISKDCDIIRYDTIAEFNVDWKAEYSALSSTRSQKKKLKQPTPVPL